MTIIVEEKWESRETTIGGNPSIELIYIVRGTSDDLTAKTALAGTAPAIYDGLIRESLHLERLTEDTWQGTARYTKWQWQPKETGDSTYQFDTGGGTQHITQSLRTIRSYPVPGKIAPDFQGAINVAGGNVEGVDITVPVYHFSETHYMADNVITGAYKATLFRLTGKVNDQPFRGFAEGEVLFLGASGSKRGEQDWEITFRFAASPNETGRQIGSITNIAKKGWEYLWIYYETKEDTQSHELVKIPIAVYVEQVYEYANFGDLGIGS